MQMSRSLGRAIGAGALLLGLPCAAELPPDTVVARVNSAVITRSALDGHLFTYFGQAGLTDFADRERIRLEAERLKVIVPDSGVDARLAELVKASGLELPKLLEREGITEPVLRARLRAGLLQEAVLNKKWPIRPADLVRLSVRYIRVAQRNEAVDVIRSLRAAPASFASLVLTRSLDKQNEGLVQPDPFLRIDKPYLYRLFDGLIQRGVLRPGQTCAEPVQSGQFWLVVKLEKQLDGSTLRPREREQATQRILGYRMPRLVEALRKLYAIEVKTPIESLTGDPRLPASQTVAILKNTAKKPAETVATITRGRLLRHLYEGPGRAGLEQLIARRVMDQVASARSLTVSATEVNDRIAELKKSVGASSFQAALDREGITEAAFRERNRYTLLAQKAILAERPPQEADLERFTARYIRVAGKDRADQVLRLLQSGQPFQQVAAQATLDRGDGFIQPKTFFRLDNPPLEKVLDASKGTLPRLHPQPIELQGSFFIVQVEARFGPETLSAKEREAHLRRLTTARLGEAQDRWHRAARIEKSLGLERLAEALNP